MILHVVGNACVDTTFYLARLPMAGETVNARDTGRSVGGKGANQAVAAARAGADVRLYAALGDDAEADYVRKVLAEDLLLDGLVAGNRPTDRSSILVEDTGENLIVTAAACAVAFDPSGDPAFLSALAPGDSLLMQGNLTADATAACLAAAGSRGVATVFNPSPLGATRFLPPVDVDLVVVNAVEAAALTGDADPGRAAERLRAVARQAVIVTLGARGAIIHGGDCVRSVAAPAVTAVDTAGAGDVFCGVTTGLWAKGMPLQRAAAIGAAAGAIAVTRRGTLASCPSRDALRSLITSHLENSP